MQAQITKLSSCNKLSADNLLRLAELRTDAILIWDDLGGKKGLPTRPIVTCGKAERGGRRIWLNTNSVAVRSCDYGATLRHELLHLLGYSHISESLIPKWKRVESCI